MAETQDSKGIKVKAPETAEQKMKHGDKAGAKKEKAHTTHKIKKKHSRHHKTLAMGDIVYTIPLRNVTKKPETFRADYAMRLIRSFLKTHTKAGEIKLGRHLNEFVWSRGKKNFPRKVRVHALRHEGAVKAELAGHEYTEFVAKKKEERTKGLMDKMKKRMTPKEEQKLKEEQLIEGKKTEQMEKKEEAKTEKSVPEQKPPAPEKPVA